MPNEENTEVDDSNPVRVLREKVKELEPAQARVSELERELAFTKAGIDLDSKAGQYFARGYDGDMTADSIRAELTELGMGSAPAPKGEEEPTPGEAASTDERGRLATNSTNEPQGEHPRTTAINEAELSLAAGASRSAAIGEAFAKLAIAGYQDKDQRVIFNPRQ